MSISIHKAEDLFRKHQSLPVLLLIAVNLVIILFVLPHYGESWDENHQYTHYADHALEAYGTWLQEGRSAGIIEDSGVAKDLHGPAFVMTVESLTRLFSRINPDWVKTDIRHFFHFLTFQIGLLSLYGICRRWLDTWPSLGASLLFVTQPVFWGHGVINPKDMPFAALFLLSIFLGLRMYDYVFPTLWEDVSTRWSSLDPQTKRRLAVILSIWALSILGLFAATKPISDLIVTTVNSAYSNPNSTIAMFFSQIAKNFHVVPADVYIQKLFIFFLRARVLYTLASTIFVMSLVARKFRPGLRLLGLPVLLAGFVLGFITSMRIAGPLAGILVTLYMLWRSRTKAILPVLIYALTAITSMYVTWPYLWSDPVGHLVESIQVMSAFPWGQQVLFNGASYTADALPRTYLPTLFAIQLTEPVWIIFLAGMIVAVTEFIRTRKYGGFLFLLVGWFVLPLLVFSVFGFSFYDNFRQVLFILPLVFLMAGVAFSRIRQPQWQIALIVLAILPGILDGIRLHPYEYIYYNRFVGGVSGAQNRFELDYWGISYRAAAEYVNSVAPANAPVWVEGPAHLFDSFARKDLKVVDAFDARILGKSYYAVALTRYNLDQVISQNTKTIYTVTCNGVPLTVIKQSEGTESDDSN